jgi:hypothetical protein
MSSCPWLNFTPDNLYFCEAQICEWVRQPANTWSSLYIVLVGVLIIYLTLVKKQGYLKLFGWIMVFLGMGTFFYHATTALWAGIFDIAGMFFLIFYLLATILWETFRIKKKTAILMFIVGSILMTSLHAIKPNLGTPFFAIIAIIAFILELRISKKERRSSRKYLVIFIILAVLSLVVWGLDATKIICDPNNHWLQGHAIWHVSTATAFYVLYLHLSKIDLPRWELL